MARRSRRRYVEQKKRGKFWHVIRTDEFPYGYYNERESRWVGSFWGYASKYRSKRTAEEVAVELACKHPDLIGVVSVLEREH